MGAITSVVRRYVPSTWRAFVGVTLNGQVLFSSGDVQALADYVKYRLFSTVVAEVAESTYYNPMLVQFLGKVTTLQFIPAAVDFWGSQIDGKTTTGTNEVLALRDPRPELWTLFEELQKQVEAESPQYGFVVYGVKGMVPRVSYGDNGRGVLLTPDPQEFPSQGNVVSDLSDLLPWSVNT